MDILNQFLNQYNETDPDATEFLKLAPEQVDQLEHRTFAVDERVNLPVFTAVQRQQFARGVPGDVPEMLRACAVLIGKRPELSRDIGATPQLFLDTAERGLSLRGLLLSSSDLAQAASDGVLVCSHVLSQSCQNVIDTVQKADTDPAISPQDRADVRAASGTLLRIKDDIARREAEAAQRAALKRAPTQQDIKNAELDHMLAQQEQRFLAEARAKAAANTTTTKLG